ncbi:hypothetical protein [Limnobacter sp.]|uniref:hypothetical protein n=1 Tax=Limnobacter sp. TaxID=2003368 RepID=UPI00259090E0|nr:hypothetical protein [Limnobacter sp.]
MPISADPEFRYKTPIAYKEFERFLNQPRTITDRRGSVSRPFSLHNLFQRMGVNCVFLKGSTVMHWHRRQLHPDIDLQFDTTDQSFSNIHEELHTFVSEHDPSGRRCDLLKSPWFSKVSQHLNEAWRGEILSLGYPSPQHSKIDLNRSNNPLPVHDTLNASKAIYFDRLKREAFEINAWSPKLVEWFRQHNLMWFEPNIDQGLTRLSYRLSKKPDLRLVQPELALHYLSKADSSESAQIAMRVLGNEYSNSRLTDRQRSELWLWVLGDLENSIKEPHAQQTIDQLLMWTQFHNLGALKAALLQPDLHPEVLKNLGNACRVGVDCKRKLLASLQQSSSWLHRLPEYLEAAMGIETPDAVEFFKLIDQWSGLLAVPEQELLTVFEPLLEQYARQVSNDHHDRATHMLGWIKGEALASALFMLDRIPKSSRASPPARLLDPLMDSSLQALRDQPDQAIAALLPELLEVRVGPAYANTLVNLLAEKAAVTRSSDSTTSQSILSALLELKSWQNTLVNSSIFEGAEPLDPRRANDLQLKLTQSLRKLDELAGPGGSLVPPMLKGLIQKKAGTLTVNWEDGLLSWSNVDSRTTIKRGGSSLSVTEQLMALQQSDRNGGPDRLDLIWSDGTFFTGTTNTETGDCSGKLFSPLDEAKVQGNPLLETGRTLCKARWPLSAFNAQTLSAEGHFQLERLLDARNLNQALQSLKDGLLEENDARGLLHVEYIVEKGKPFGCIAVNNSDGQQAGLQMRFEPAATETSDPLSRSHGVKAVTEDISRDFSVVFLPMPTATLSFSSAWNVEENSLSGQAQIRSSGKSPFLWSGELDDQDQPKPGGVLQLPGTRVAVKPYTDTADPQCVPIRFLPVMADVMGPALRGKFAFEPRIHLSQTEWPKVGFEGFVSELNCGSFRFSGYIGAGGRAAGLLKIRSNNNLFSDRAIRGNFLIAGESISPGLEKLRDLTGIEPVVVTLPDGRTLRPHGFCENHLLDYQSVSAYKTGQSVYFNGVALRADQITRHTEQVYDTPGAPQYFSGTDLEFKGKTLQADVVINAGDGSPDFLWIRPPGYERNVRYQANYFNASGYHASLLMLNQKIALANLTFPSGLVYKGQIGFVSPSLYGPAGQGKIEKGTLRFSGHFKHNQAIEKLVADNLESENLLRGATQRDRITLPSLLERINAAEQDYGIDLQSHMRQRDFRHLHAQAQVFKPEPSQSITLRELQRQIRRQGH